jgi:glycosyltransferase involved in cell wall biosynthesis
MGARIVLLAQCITEDCVARRNNANYLSVAGRKKCLNLCAYLAALGHSVTILSNSYAKGTFLASSEWLDLVTEIRHAPTLALFRRWTLFKRSIASAFNVWELLKRRGSTDLIVIYNYHAEFAIPALFAAKFTGVPFILDYEDGLFLDRGYQSAFYRAIERAIYRACSGIIYVNQRLAERVDPVNAGMPHVVIHSYFNHARALDLKASPGTRREVLFAGNFSRGFGFDELKRYIVCLPPDYTLNICGRAGKSETKEIEALCSTHANARLLGFVPQQNLLDLMQRAKAAILLNDLHSEFNNTNFPSKLYDYMSNGKIVICTRNPLLRSYSAMNCLLQIDSIEQEFPQLDRLLTTRRFVPEEVAALHANVLGELSRVIDASMRQP